MKKIFSFLFLLAVIHTSQAQIKISQLPLVSGTDADSLEIPVVQNGVTKKAKGYIFKGSGSTNLQEAYNASVVAGGGEAIVDGNNNNISWNNFYSWNLGTDISTETGNKGAWMGLDPYSGNITNDVYNETYESFVTTQTEGAFSIGRPYGVRTRIYSRANGDRFADPEIPSRSNTLDVTPFRIEFSSGDNGFRGEADTLNLVLKNLAIRAKEPSHDYVLAVDDTGGVYKTQVDGSGSGGGIASVQSGTDITVDNSDPLNPVINYTGAGVTYTPGAGIQISNGEIKLRDTLNGAGSKFLFHPDKFGAVMIGYSSGSNSDVSQTGSSSVNIGYDNKVPGYGSAVIGGGNITNSAAQTYVYGGNNQVSGTHKIFGSYNVLAETFGPNTIVGDNNRVDASTGAYTTIIGNNNRAKAGYSLAIGQSLVAQGYLGLVIGHMNDTTAAGSLNSFSPSNRIFQIGNGQLNINQRSNAMTVLKSGNVGFGNTAATLAPDENLVVAGNFKMFGAYMPNGDAGTSGNVLSSNGPGVSPTWIPMASSAAKLDSTETKKRISDSLYFLKDNRRGIVYEKTTFANTSDFTATGFTPTISGNYLRIAGGSSDFTKYVTINNLITSDEDIEMEVKFIIRTAPNSSGFGIGIGKKSINSYYTNSFVGQFSMATGNAGIYMNKGDFTNIKTVTDATFSGWSVNDTIVARWKQVGNVISCQATNLNTGYVLNSQYKDSLKDPTAVTARLPTTSQFAIYEIGNQILDIVSVKVNSYSKLNQVAFVGDSKLHGYAAVDIKKRAANLCGAITYAGGGDRTVEMAQSIPYLITLKPKLVVLNIGRNDLASSVTTGTWQANYTSIVTQLTGAGIKVIHLLPIPETLDQTALYNYIVSTYGLKNCINPIADYNTTNFNSTDNVHPNANGNQFLADLILSSNKLN